MSWYNPIDWFAGVNSAEARGREIDQQIADIDRAKVQSRYAPGGDIYASLELEYGRAGADRVYQAWLTGEPAAVSSAIGNLKHGAPLSTSTGGQFVKQLTTDPFGAPLDGANKLLGQNITNAMTAVLRNPWVLLLIASIAFHYLGGTAWLAKQMRSA